MDATSKSLLSRKPKPPQASTEQPKVESSATKTLPKVELPPDSEVAYEEEGPPIHNQTEQEFWDIIAENWDKLSMEGFREWVTKNIPQDEQERVLNAVGMKYKLL